MTLFIAISGVVLGIYARSIWDGLARLWSDHYCDDTLDGHDTDYFITCGFLADRDPAFRDFVESLPDTHWAKYDLSAMRLGWEAYRVLHGVQDDA